MYSMYVDVSLAIDAFNNHFDDAAISE